MGSRRYRTAVERVGLSRPVALALRDGLISLSTTVFDYGCGRGGDVRILRGMGIESEGWDPFFVPHASFRTADVVILSYVLNVIEDVNERVEALAHAFALARGLLVVAVRIDHGISDVPSMRNGLWTGAGTFQKYFTHPEFLGLLAKALGIRPYSVATGVAYAFKAADVENSYADRVAPPGNRGPQLKHGNGLQQPEAGAEFASLARELGRLPTRDEWLGHSRSASAGGPETLLVADNTRFPAFSSSGIGKPEILGFLTLLHRHRIPPPNFRSLPAGTRREILRVWGGYYAALREASEDASAAAVQDLTSR